MTTLDLSIISGLLNHIKSNSLSPQLNNFDKFTSQNFDPTISFDSLLTSSLQSSSTLMNLQSILSLPFSNLEVTDEQHAAISQNSFTILSNLIFNALSVNNQDKIKQSDQIKTSTPENTKGTKRKLNSTDSRSIPSYEEKKKPFLLKEETKLGHCKKKEKLIEPMHSALKYNNNHSGNLENDYNSSFDCLETSNFLTNDESSRQDGNNNNLKKNYKSLSFSRRKQANARERDRVQHIGRAFDQLRSTIPNYMYSNHDCIEENVTSSNFNSSSSQKLSKLAVLRIACDYIQGLMSLLDQSPDSDNDSSKLSTNSNSNTLSLSSSSSSSSSSRPFPASASSCASVSSSASSSVSSSSLLKSNSSHKSMDLDQPLNLCNRNQTKSYSIDRIIERLGH